MRIVVDNNADVILCTVAWISHKFNVSILYQFVIIELFQKHNLHDTLQHF